MGARTAEGPRAANALRPAADTPTIHPSAAAKALQATLAPLAGHGTLYLLGIFEAPSSRATPPKVEVTVDWVALNWAALELLEAWHGHEPDLAAQAHHAPGKTQTATLHLAERAPQVDLLLDRWQRLSAATPRQRLLETRTGDPPTSGGGTRQGPNRPIRHDRHLTATGGAAASRLPARRV